MWASILLFAILLPILVFSAIISTIAFLVVLLRRKSASEPIQFTGIIFAYAALMMLVGLFLVASGFGLVAKALIGTAISHDFAYKIHDTPGDDAVYGAVVLIVGAVMLIPHAVGVVLLGHRGVGGGAPVLRGFNLIGLATATIGFLASGGTALDSILERTTDERAVGWTQHHPGEPLAFAVILLPLVGWFTCQLWIDVTRDVAKGTAEAV
jgi:hypothetical protein